MIEEDDIDALINEDAAKDRKASSEVGQYTLIFKTAMTCGRISLSSNFSPSWIAYCVTRIST